MRRGFRSRALLVLFPVALVGCGDITLDNLGEYVVTYKVTVQLLGSEEKLVSISTPDVKQRASITSGSITATAFKPGVVTVRVGDPGRRRFELQAKAESIESSLEAGLLSADSAKALRDELLALRNAPDDPADWVTCTTEVKPGPQPSGGENLVYVLGAAADGSLRLSGPGC